MRGINELNNILLEQNSLLVKLIKKYPHNNTPIKTKHKRKIEQRKHIPKQLFSKVHHSGGKTQLF